MASGDHKDVLPEKPAAGSSSDPALPTVPAEEAEAAAQISTPEGLAGTNTVEAEPDDYDADHDSTFEGSLASSTTSIGSSILKHKEENGRRYHAYKEGKYVLPNDEQEKDRLDLQHFMCTTTLDGRLHLAPVTQAQRVLDIGTGTGIWAIDYADEHPESQVIGIDLSPIQPDFTPPNCVFEIDDLEEPWTFNKPFDFIYARMMTGSFSDWPRYFTQCYEHLVPGGYVEMLDLAFPGQTEDNSFPPNSALRRWGDLIIESTAKISRPADSMYSYQEQLTAAGFTNVTVEKFKWPGNRWPKDARLKELGMYTHSMLGDSLTGLSQALFTRVLGWSMEELELFLVDVRNEMKDTKIHCYYDIYVVYGQKPK